MICVGMDPSLTGFGVATPAALERIVTLPKHGDLSQRSTMICDRLRALCEAYPGQPMTWVMEAPLLDSAWMAKKGLGSHLWEMGWVFCRLDILGRLVSKGRPQFRILYTDTSTLRKVTLGHGGVKTSQLPSLIRERYGLAIENDRKRDKCIAFLCRRYGEMVAAGEWAHVPPAPRGKGVKAKAAERKKRAAREETSVGNDA